jgi:hypothetical protein
VWGGWARITTAATGAPAPDHEQSQEGHRSDGAQHDAPLSHPGMTPTLRNPAIRNSEGFRLFTTSCSFIGCPYDHLTPTGVGTL